MSIESENGGRARYLLDGRRVTVRDLVEAKLVAADAELVFRRARVRAVHRATITEAGRIRLEDGQEYSSPSRAAMVAAGMRAVDGWLCWIVVANSRPLDALRQELLDQVVT